MITNSYLTLTAVGHGEITILPGQPIELTDEQAEILRGNGSITDLPRDEKSLFELPDDAFNAALAGLKLDQLKSTAAQLALDAGAAKTKADFVALIQAAREAAK